MRRVTALVALATLSGMTGCGTVLNLCGDRHIYGGASIDSTVASTGILEGITGKGETNEFFTTTPVECFVIGSIALLDLPISTVTDTLTLAVTIPTAFKEKATPTEPAIDPGAVPVTWHYPNKTALADDPVPTTRPPLP